MGTTTATTRTTTTTTVTTAGTASRFWNWTADRYARQSISDEASYKKKLEITQKYLTSNMQVVEFGCGTGSTAIVHAPKVNAYHAIDVSEKMIEIARNKAEQAGISNMTFKVGTLEQVGEADASCDALLGLNTLHLVPDLPGTLATVARMLKPGGYFFSSTICLTQLTRKLRLLAKGASVIPFLPTVGAFSEEELIERHAKVGLRIEERFSQAKGVVFLVAVKE